MSAADPDHPDRSVLANAIWHALTGPQSDLAIRLPRAARYPVDVTPFAGLSDPTDPAAWADLERLAGPGGIVAVAAPVSTVPPPWQLLNQLAVEQMHDDDVALDRRGDPDVAGLDAADVPDMLELVRRTDPGPFLPRTIELGGFVGIRVEGRLVAMAGRRMHPPGWVEVTAVCTDPDFRGLGLARRVLDAVVGGIHAEGERAYLHVLTSNTSATQLYRSYGFVHGRDVDILVVQAQE
jgi:predicted GNAT family acetyltransferase